MQSKIDIIPVIRNLNHWPRFRLRLLRDLKVIRYTNTQLINYKVKEPKA